MYLKKNAKKYKKLIPICFYVFITFFGYGQEKSNFIKLDQTFASNSNIIEDQLGFIWTIGKNEIFHFKVFLEKIIQQIVNFYWVKMEKIIFGFHHLMES